jgi:hypothetical protein
VLARWLQHQRQAPRTLLEARCVHLSSLSSTSQCSLESTHNQPNATPHVLPICIHTSGGSIGCKVKNCTKRAKARGLCWGHGGGTKCSNVHCDKVAVSEGLCWAHGGGKRCLHVGCKRPGYERTLNYCVKHHAELSGSSEEKVGALSGGVEGTDSDMDANEVLIEL